MSTNYKYIGVSDGWINVKGSNLRPDPHSQHNREYVSDEVMIYCDGEKYITNWIKIFDINHKNIIFEGWIIVLRGELDNDDITHWIDVGIPKN
jgi:hypothetical protein